MSDRLANYVPVSERVAQAQPNLRSVHADTPVMLTDAMGYIRVTVVLNDDRSATGTASFRLDVQGRSAQATNPIEDCETSALGRALAFLGYETARGIASREEVQEAERRATYQPQGRTNGAAQAERVAGGASTKQIGLIRKLMHEHEWNEASILQSARRHGIADVESLTALDGRQASALIDALQQAATAATE
jgi:hypothetical protein